MKQVLLYCMAFCLLIGCSKHHDKPAAPGNDPDPAPAKPLRIKSINGNTFNYDSLGRLIRSFYSNSITARTEYTYTRDSMIGRDYDRQGNLHGGSQVFYFGSDGLATREKYIIDNSITPLILTFTYNSQHQLIGQIVGEEGKAPTTRSTYYYSKGNMDSSKTYSIPDNTLLSYERFEYYTDKPNLLSNEHNGISFVGVGNANLAKKEVRVNSGATTTTEYTYEFDSGQRPAKSHTNVDGASWTDLTYTWF